jgi:aryl-alcohol dehydrogenase-like predicted oxidoreductase
MQYRKFGNTDLLVSEIGFGAWAIGGDAMVGTMPIGWGPANDRESKEAIRAAIDRGINFFDTADIYGLGHSEKLLGETLAAERVLIASKVGNVARGNEFTVDYSKEYILKACERSLQRLRRETIDYYQLHTARIEHLKTNDCVEAMQLLQRQGKIRYWGISLNTFAPHPEAEFFMQHHLGNGFQLVLNIINQRALPLVHQASVEGYGIIARMPLQFGLLTGKFNKSTHFEKSDHRHNRLVPAVIEAAQTAMEPVWKLCEKYQVSKAGLALSYILSYPSISTVIPGIRTKDHVIANTTDIVTLEPGDVEFIESCNADHMIPLMDRIERQG